MKFKHFAIILALFSFSASLFAQPATYSFSSFGDGLPSSAAKVSMAGAKKTTTERIIIAEDDEEDEEIPDYDYSDEPKVNKNKKTGLIVTYVVLGVVVTAGIIVGAYYLTNESANCCATVSDNLAQGCAEGCGESCGQSCGESSSDACASSSSDACSSSSSDACSSSTSSNTTTCTTSNISGIFTNGLQLIPIYVP